MSAHLNLSTGKFLNSSTLFKLSDALLLDVSSGEIVMSNLLVPKAGVDLFKLASLDLNFAQRKSLTDSVSGNNLITFSRASSGTYVDSDGLIKTSVVNLATYSEDLTQRTALDATTPTATLLQATAQSGSQTPYAAINVFTFPETNTAYTVYADFEKVSIRYAIINFQLFSTNGPCIYDLDTGTVSNQPAGFTCSMTDSGGGIYRCTATLTTGADATGRISFGMSQLSTIHRVTDPTTADQIIIHRIQIEEGTTATDYIPTGATKSGAPRFDHDPVTGESLGLLIEEERTNYFQFSASTSLFNTLVTTPAPSQGFTAPDGSTDAYQYPINSTDRLQSNRTVPAGQTHTLSFFAKQGGGTNLQGYNGFSTGGQRDPSGSIYNWTTGVLQSGWTKEDYANGWSRFYKSYTSTTGTLFVLQLKESYGVLLWGFQLELNATFPTSYIPTSSSAVTRSPDIASIEGTNFSSWYNQSEGTMFSTTSSVTNLESGAARTPYTIFEATSNRHGFSYRGGLDDFVQQTHVGGTRQFTPVDSGDPTYTNDKVAYSYSNTGGSTVHNSQEWSSSTSDLSVINPTVLQIGRYNSSLILNGHITRLAYFTTRKTDQELIDLTT